MLGLAEGRPLSSQKTIGKSDRLLGLLKCTAKAPETLSAGGFFLGLDLRPMA
ncbi:hypothetical protein [Pseudomonas sp.]|uniref:hypothetical protein n=1 Tax=Pseudomonas sp. TaxID=306 RepID=UPI0037CBBA29